MVLKSKVKLNFCCGKERNFEYARKKEIKDSAVTSRLSLGSRRLEVISVPSKKRTRLSKDEQGCPKMNEVVAKRNLLEGSIEPN